MKARSKLVDLDWLESNFPCMQACPVHTQAGRYVTLIAEGRYEEAYRYWRQAVDAMKAQRLSRREQYRIEGGLALPWWSKRGTGTL